MKLANWAYRAAIVVAIVVAFTTRGLGDGFLTTVLCGPFMFFTID